MPPSPSGWPWPLNGVQLWFEGLWNQISDAAVNAVSVVSDWIHNALEAFKPFIEASVSWVWDKVKPLLGPIAEWVEKAAAWAWEGLWTFLKDPVSALKAGWDAVGTAVKGFFDDLGTQLTEGWNWITNKVGEVGDALGKALNDGWNWLKTNVGDPIMANINQIGGWVSNALAGVASALGEGLKAVWDWIFKHLVWLGQMVMGAVNAVVATIGDIVTGLVRGFVDTITGAVTPGSPPQELEVALTVMTDSVTVRTLDIIKEAYASPSYSPAVLPAAVKLVGTLLTAKTAAEAAAAAGDQAHPVKHLQLRTMVASLTDSLGLGAMIAAITTLPVTVGMVAPLRYWYQETFTPYIPMQGDLTRLTTERLLTIPEFYANMRKQGLNEFWSDRMLQAAYRVPGYGELQQMLWREKISMSTLEGALRLTGIREDFIAGYVELTKRIPGPGDLITMVVREVITPGDFYRFMPMQGFVREWALRYWEMHWILLPLGEVRRARHLGLINDDELGKYLVLHDYKPEARPGIRTSDQDLAAKLVWNLPGRIEARWMFRWGIRDRDGLKDLLIKGGLDPAYADEVTDAVATNQFLREIRMQETNIKTDLRDGYIFEETARANLLALGYPTAFVEYHVQDALKDRERTHKKGLLSYYRDCFLKDIPSEPPFEAAVRGILVVEAAADLYIERTYVQKIGKQKAA